MAAYNLTLPAEEHTVMRFLAMRYDLTGITIWRYYSGKDFLFEAKIPVLPSPTVYIIRDGIFLTSSFDRENTICPGRTRSVIEKETGKTVFSIRFDDSSNYTILETEQTIHASYNDKRGVVFTAHGKEIGQLCRLFGSTSFLLDDAVSSCRADILAECDASLTESEKLAILSFPLLRFDSREIPAALVARKDGINPLETGIAIQPYTQILYLEDLLSFL